MPYYRCPACGLTSYSAAGYSTASVCPTCSEPLTEDSRRYLVPGAEHGVQRMLQVRPEAAAQARRLLVGFALPEATRHALALVVTELVTNSIRHGGLPDDDVIDLHVTADDHVVRVAVHDSGSGFIPPAPADDPLVVGGKGFVIVDALCDAWGVDCDRDGCTVWCELPVDEAPVAAVELRVPARSQSGVA